MIRNSFRGTVLRPAVMAGLLCAASTFLQADTLELKWSIAPGDRSYMGTGNLERGVAYNPVSNHLLVLSRAGTPTVWVLDAATGEEKYSLSNGDGIIAGGTFAMNLVGVGDDGAVYVGNLATASPPVFKLYRWADDAEGTTPQVAFQGDPAAGASNQRWGDSMAVRGSGAGTQVVIGSRNSAQVAVLSTADGTAFTAKVIQGVAAASGSLGISFGPGNTIYSKVGGSVLRLASFDLAAGTSTLVSSYASFYSTVTPLLYEPSHKQLAGIALETPDSVRLFDVADTASAPVPLDSKALPTDNANGNGTGALAFGPDLVFVLDTNNGLQCYKIVRAAAAEAPKIVTEPTATTVLEGGSPDLTVSASGTPPLAFQWFFKGAIIPGATKAVLTLTNVTVDQAGAYSVTVTNIAGSKNSAEAVLTVVPVVKGPQLTPAWKLLPESVPWLSTDNSQRGLAYNPKTGNVLVVSRVGSNRVEVIEGATGKSLHSLNVDPAVVFGGTYAVNVIGVADDGAVYVANLTTDGTASSFNLYRWADDAAATVPTLAYSGDPGEGTVDRWGDCIAVRGSGASTQVLLAARNSTAIAVLSTTDGENFSSARFDVAGATAGGFGLGVAWGKGDTFWGKASGFGLSRATIDFSGNSATLDASFGTADFPLAVGAIAVDTKLSFLAGLAFENPDNIRLYDLGDLSAPPVLIDQEFAAADNLNGNLTGALAFGGGMLWALDSNNGIAAFSVSKAALPPTLSAPKLFAGIFSFSISGEAGRSYLVEGSYDLKSWSTVKTVTLTGTTSATVQDAGAGAGYRFYRAKAQ